MHTASSIYVCVRAIYVGVPHLWNTSNSLLSQITGRAQLRENDNECRILRVSSLNSAIMNYAASHMELLSTAREV